MNLVPWLICIWIAMNITLIAALLAVNYCGKQGIAGAPNTVLDRCKGFIALTLAGLGWYLIVIATPTALGWK